jgi:hypothetical protein
MRIVGSAVGTSCHSAAHAHGVLPAAEMACDAEGSVWLGAVQGGFAAGALSIQQQHRAVPWVFLWLLLPSSNHALVQLPALHQHLYV